MPITPKEMTFILGSQKKYLALLSFNGSPYMTINDMSKGVRDQNGNVRAAPKIYTDVEHIHKDVKSLMLQNNLLPSQVDLVIYAQLEDDSYASVAEIFKPNEN